VRKRVPARRALAAGLDAARWYELVLEWVKRPGLRHLRRERRDEGEKDADADEHVRDCEELAGIRFGRKVAVPDGGQGCDAEVERVNDAKPFDDRVEPRAGDDRITASSASELN
jgi:hypothetical protein